MLFVLLSNAIRDIDDVCVGGYRNDSTDYDLSNIKYIGNNNQEISRFANMIDDMSNYCSFRYTLNLNQLEPLYFVLTRLSDWEMGKKLGKFLSDRGLKKGIKLGNFTSDDIIEIIIEELTSKRGNSIISIAGYSRDMTRKTNSFGNISLHSEKLFRFFGYSDYRSCVDSTMISTQLTPVTMQFLELYKYGEDLTIDDYRILLSIVHKIEVSKL